MVKTQTMKVQGIDIAIYSHNNNDFICLTDMVKAKEDSGRAADIIKNWIRNRSTIEFLGTWESIYNPNFNVVEFDHFRKNAGLPTFTLSVKQWVEKTNAIGIKSISGKYGGTYAHKDIAFEFGSAINPIFKIYIIKEYQRLKSIENDKHGLEWNVRRILSKTNYQVHTEAIKNYIIPKSGYAEHKEWLLYADEADMLNICLFGCTAKQWREANPQRFLNGENIRDMASINELAILSNLESLNSTLIKNGVEKKDRFRILSETVRDQIESLKKVDFLNQIKKETNSTYIDAKEGKLSSHNQDILKVLNFNPKEKPSE